MSCREFIIINLNFQSSLEVGSRMKLIKRNLFKKWSFFSGVGEVIKQEIKDEIKEEIKEEMKEEGCGSKLYSFLYFDHIVLIFYFINKGSHHLVVQ